MNLTNLSDKVEMQEFKINGEWHMRGSKAEWNEIVLPQHPDIRYSKVSRSVSQFRPSVSGWHGVIQAQNIATFSVPGRPKNGAT